MKIVVLCGGTSSERTVSLSTSEKVGKALQGRGHDVILIDVFFGSEKELSFDEKQDITAAADAYRAMTDKLDEELAKDRPFFGKNVVNVCSKADIVFLGLHGANGEDGRVQAAFDLLGIKYTGSGYLSSAIAMSKTHTKYVLNHFIPMPKGYVLTKEDPHARKLPAPCVMKPSNGGSSLGVFIINDDAVYESALEKVFQYDDTILLEEFVKGRELTQGVLNGVALPPVEICPKEGFYDYLKKYNGETVEICPAPIDEKVLEEMSNYSVLAGRLLGLSVYYRVDYLLDDEGKLFCLEVNSLPGMTSTSLVPQEAAAVGIEYPELCEKIIEYSLKKYE
ncbi:MAG: D-alanine--D-alanine ligase [Lachnospiraceae bacterium]|nr:D-alanine--D-alanine ligase [Lachnospiraceae bacterium]MBR6350272.1 D-alanine--D-alanine ligase [Lachnospiraceae bacterium]